MIYIPRSNKQETLTVSNYRNSKDHKGKTHQIIIFQGFFISLEISWHSDVVTMLSQRRDWRCHNVVVRSKMGDAATSVFYIVKTLSRRCHNVATTSPQHQALRFWFLSAIETWESYKSTWILNLVFGKRDAP